VNYCDSAMSRSGKPGRLFVWAESGVAGLILEGGKRVRQVRPSHRSWTVAKQRAFLEALAESCNVKLAAKRAGVSTSMAYVRRGKDASFRAGWDRALATGYAQLEMMLLERALHGVEKIVIARDGTKTVMREYSDRVALALLRMHRDNAMLADENVDDQEWLEARERIVERLQRLRDQDKVETKSANVAALIKWALQRP
jgi:hypothetical protein